MDEREWEFGGSVGGGVEVVAEFEIVEGMEWLGLG